MPELFRPSKADKALFGAKLPLIVGIEEAHCPSMLTDASSSRVASKSSRLHPHELLGTPGRSTITTDVPLWSSVYVRSPTHLCDISIVIFRSLIVSDAGIEIVELAELVPLGRLMGTSLLL